MGFGVWGLGCGVWALGFMVQGLGFKVALLIAEEGEWVAVPVPDAVVETWRNSTSPRNNSSGGAAVNQKRDTHNSTCSRDVHQHRHAVVRISFSHTASINRFAKGDSRTNPSTHTFY